jgi:hypothetical protein
VFSCVITSSGARVRGGKGSASLLAVLLLAFPSFLNGQTDNPPNNPERPVPILTGSAGFFASGNGGERELVPIVMPVVLVPFGERWLVEARGEFKGEFLKPAGSTSFGGPVEKEVDYVQVDFIANAKVTVTVGRFLTPFGIYNERLYPIWIRSLQRVPTIFPIGSGSSNGVMLRGGLRASPNANVNYAVYFSTNSDINKLESDRLAGGRVGVFFPRQRVEIGASFQQLLQEGRSRSAGVHFAWQPAAAPMNLRSEVAWSGEKGRGYWVEGAYRLSQISKWQKVMRHTEAVGRVQQFFAGGITSDVASEYGLPTVNAQELDLGVNYYFRDGFKATTSYGREFSSVGNANRWTIGTAYRFAFPLGRM